MNPEEELQIGCELLGVILSDQEKRKLLSYLELLVKWNRAYNLTAIRDISQMVSHHLLDSLAVIAHMWEGKWLDVGCGAGLPGLVIAIAKPEWSLVLIDSNSKKTSFVQQAIIELGLKNASVVCARVEEWKPETRFDGIISRAFSELNSFIRNTNHLLAPGGRWMAMKGVPDWKMANLPEECWVVKHIELQVPGISAARSIVVTECESHEE